MTDLAQSAAGAAHLEADPGLRRHRLSRLAGAARRTHHPGRVAGRPAAASPANRPCRRAPAAPMPASTRSAQVASFALQAPIPPENLQRALNRTLPPSIRILEARTVRSTFHARHSAVAKTYEYRVFRGAICPPFLARYVYACPWPMDVEALQRSARLFEGEHDFLSFAATDPDLATRNSFRRTELTTRTQKRPRRRRPPGKRDSNPNHLLLGLGASARPSPAHCSFTASAATAFSTTWSATWWEPCSMSAAAICESEDIPAILAARSRAAAGPTAPARGLFPALRRVPGRRYTW